MKISTEIEKIAKTNFMTEYVICFNHHDCLMGCGTAKNWVNKL